MARDQLVHITAATVGAILAGALAAVLAAACWNDDPLLPAGVFSVAVALLQSAVQLVVLDVLLRWLGVRTVLSAVTGVVAAVAGGIVVLAFGLCGVRIALGQTVPGSDTAWRAAVAFAGLIPWVTAAVLSRPAMRRRLPKPNRG